MEEKVLTDKKHGMRTLVICVLVIIASLACAIWGVTLQSVAMIAAGLVVFILSWIPLLGLRILRPNEALVLTLFGKYVGTIKGDGFYAINPFCAAVNPAANTRLNQSGDVKKTDEVDIGVQLGTALNFGGSNRRISLKIMTLNNNRQKINDCLGNPVEIGIAVTWRVVDTAKATLRMPPK